MTHKEIAERLRDMSNRIGSLTQSSLAELADQIDPPLFEPGTVVWWRYLTGSPWFLGTVNNSGVVQQFGTSESPHWSQIEYKPARIAGPMQEIIDIPPVSEWPEKTDDVNIWAQYTSGLRGEVLKRITRAEAKRREAEG